MDLYELRKQCMRLFNCSTLKVNIELIDIYSNYFFEVLKEQRNVNYKTRYELHAAIINQMMFSKVLHIKKIIEGVHYKGKEGPSLNHVIDPTILASLIRAIYETTCMFNLVFLRPKSDDEKLILHNLWLHSGLKYRQSFETSVTKEENIFKLNNERKEMEILVEQIKSTKLFSHLSSKNQRKIDGIIQKKEYKIQFIGNEVSLYSWKKLNKVTGIKPGFLDHLYTYFSFYSHP